MKKIAAVFLSLIIFTTTTAFAVSDFTDVNDSTYYKPSIDWAAENGVINGYSDGSFGPDLCVNRVELLKMLFETLEVDIDSYDTPLFSDTSEGQWYTPYVIAGRARGTIEGYPDGTFRPNQCVKRVEAIKMAVLEFTDGKVPGHTAIFGNPYDVATTLTTYEESLPWWYDYYATVMSENSIGTEHFIKYDLPEEEWSHGPTYNLGLGESMSRKEVAEMLYRMKAIEDNGRTDLGFGYYDGKITPNDLVAKP